MLTLGSIASQLSLVYAVQKWYIWYVEDNDDLFPDDDYAENNHAESWAL